MGFSERIDNIFNWTELFIRCFCCCCLCCWLLRPLVVWMDAKVDNNGFRVVCKDWYAQAPIRTARLFHSVHVSLICFKSTHSVSILHVNWALLQVNLIYKKSLSFSQNATAGGQSMDGICYYSIIITLVLTSTGHENNKTQQKADSVLVLHLILHRLTIV